MDFLQTLDSNTITLILLGAGVLCIGGIVLFFLSQVLGILGGIIGGLASLVGGFASNPLSCCGCLVAIAVAVVCGGFIWVIAGAVSACGTPAATNLCTLLGR